MSVMIEVRIVFTVDYRQRLKSSVHNFENSQFYCISLAKTNLRDNLTVKLISSFEETLPSLRSFGCSWSSNCNLRVLSSSSCGEQDEHG